MTGGSFSGMGSTNRDAQTHTNIWHIGQNSEVLEPKIRFPLGTKKYLVLPREPMVLLNFPAISAS